MHECQKRKKKKKTGFSEGSGFAQNDAFNNGKEVIYEQGKIELLKVVKSEK